MSGPDAEYLYSDADDNEATQVAPSAAFIESQAKAGESAQPLKVPMPSGSAPRQSARQAAHQPSEPADIDADTFFEEAELDRALDSFSGHDVPVDRYGSVAGSIEVDFRGGSDGYDESRQYGDGGYDEGPFELPKMDQGELGVPRQQARAHSVPPFLPLAPPLPPTELPPFPGMSGVDQAAYQSAAFQAVGSVTGSYPAYTGQIPYIVQPVITAPAAGPSRWAVVLIFALIVTMAAGVGLGWLLFAGARPGGPFEASRAAAPPPEAQPAAPTAAKVASAAPAASAPGTAESAAAPAGRDSGPIAADVVSLEHPPLARVAAPLRGEIGLSPLRSTRPVRKGDRLFEVRRKRSAGEDEARLAARVTELEELAADDKVYEAFLARARSEYKRAQKGGVVAVAIRASSDGVAAPTVKRGDQVAQGQILATISDPRSWKAKASLRADGITREWRCSITSREGSSRASCTIEQVSLTADGAEVTASVDAAQAPWLGTPDPRPRLLLEPPSR